MDTPLPRKSNNPLYKLLIASDVHHNFTIGYYRLERIPQEITYKYAFGDYVRISKIPNK